MRRDQLTLLTLIASLAVGGAAIIGFDKSGNPELVKSALGKELLLVPRVTEEAPISLTASDGTGLKLTNLRAHGFVVPAKALLHAKMGSPPDEMDRKEVLTFSEWTINGKALEGQ